MSTRETYEEYYQRSGHYGKNIGVRSQTDYQRHRQWFYGWLKYIGQKIILINYRHQPVIDLGGGIGAFSSLLTDNGFKSVTCADISREALRLANKFNPSLKTLLLDIEKSNIKQQYQLVFALELIEHLGKPQLGISNIYRLLKEKGVFIGTSPYPFPKGYQDPTHRQVLKPAAWRGYFLKAGFRQVYTWPMSFFPYLYRICRYLNVCLPWYIKNRYFVSTTLIVAYK